ncbi:MAG TPA: YIP1 family protein [Gemmatimonadales bacterium]|nr:YIP1 family protein [Gemmatimonadales bacterium]
MTVPPMPSQADAAPTASLVEDFVDIWFTPTAVFARRANASFWAPLIVVTLLLGGLFLLNSRLLEPLMDAEFERGMAAAMEANPQMTPEMAAQGRAIGQTFAKVGAFVFVPIAIVLVGLVLWVAGRVVEARISVGTALVVAAYSYFPRVLEGLLSGIQGIFMSPDMLDGRYRVTLGVGRFLDPDTTSPLLLAVLGRVDLFTIWVTVLLAIGLSVTGKVSRGSAAVAAGLVWVAGALPTVLQALRA